MYSGKSFRRGGCAAALAEESAPFFVLRPVEAALDETTMSAGCRFEDDGVVAGSSFCGSSSARTSRWLLAELLLSSPRFWWRADLPNLSSIRRPMRMVVVELRIGGLVEAEEAGFIGDCRDRCVRS